MIAVAVAASSGKADPADLPTHAWPGHGRRPEAGRGVRLHERAPVLRGPRPGRQARQRGRVQPLLMPGTVVAEARNAGARVESLFLQALADGDFQP